jgi:hypothetical protein
MTPKRRNEKIRLSMPRLRTVVIAAAVIVVTDGTWNGTSLTISLGWPQRKPIASLVFPGSDVGPTPPSL